ncbi:hypothetical protein T03_11932 [Trichinella britovi]|uniref:Uncharacterized protein n=1 Tax=Trichinella britovi TaxID=45882 RepID=A0A0V1CJ74_TRIBR|nr:hypothetical protein T03_11932 [Trichinella britovi]
MLTTFGISVTYSFNQVNSPNRKLLSILEYPLTMNQTLRRAASHNQESSFLQNYPATGLLRICPKPFYFRMDQSDAGPAICTYQAQQERGGEKLIAINLWKRQLVNFLHIMTPAIALWLLAFSSSALPVNMNTDRVTAGSCRYL